MPPGWLQDFARAYLVFSPTSSGVPRPDTKKALDRPARKRSRRGAYGDNTDRSTHYQTILAKLRLPNGEDGFRQIHII